MRQISPILMATMLVLAACQGNGPSGTTTASAPAGSSSSTRLNLSPEVEQIIAAAKAGGENELDLSWGETTIGGAAAAKQFGDAFNRAYGLKVATHFTPGPTMTDIAGRITQEAAAGQKASTDVYLGSEGHFAALLGRNSLEGYDYTKLSPRIRSEIMVTKNIGVEIASRFPGITYNSKLVRPDEVPKKLGDLLAPRWKGKIASEPNAASLDRAAFRPEWSPNTMKGFVSQLSQNIGGLMRCEELERVSSGEFEMFGMDCGSYEVKRQQAKGAPLGHAIPEDGALAVFWFMGVPRTAAHPNLAKLYIGLVLSEEGQKILYQSTYADLHSLPGSQTAAELKGLEAKGIKPLTIDPQFIIDHPEDVKLREELTAMLRQKG